MAIKECVCKHEEQDKLHGKQKRVANPITKQGSEGYFRCTVCGGEIRPKPKPIIRKEEK